ncbi:uncharacterized protein LOC133179722 [Saccostrea echinata]|uniref:uncharacterized protein LOC133179722 n=1 Tax=Saccostrea echinata TaxID=191078 RepID=UPI002A80D604|nr:uncharacterized protein LOC133179722 [Saccostrea echinata]
MYNNLKDGPESVMITPKPGNDTITIKDGKPLGPYNCSAHCNPPCTLQWKYKHPSGDFVNDTSYDISSLPLPMLNADRTRMTLIRCVAINRVGSANKDIKLKILYFEDPRVYINEKLQYSSTINEGTPLNVTCLLGGNPTPEVILRKLTANKIIGEGHFNYTWIKDAKCSDTSNYSCEGKSSEFESRIQSFHINVTCRFMSSLQVSIV